MDVSTIEQLRQLLEDQESLAAQVQAILDRVEDQDPPLEDWETGGGPWPLGLVVDANQVLDAIEALEDQGAEIWDEGVVYMTMEELSRRPTRRIILDGRPTEARSIFSMSAEYAEGQMDQEAPDPAKVLAAKRRQEAQRRLQANLILNGMDLLWIDRALNDDRNVQGHALVTLAKLARALGLDPRGAGLLG